MLNGIFGKRPTTKGDVIMAIGALAIAAFKVIDTLKEFKAEQNKKEIER